MSGEETQELGAEGARRAKKWLDRTTRADARWVNPDRIAVPKLSFSWPGGGTFSYDIGGLLRGEGIDGQEFLAESKYYTNAGDQGSLYVEYLAKCYVARGARPDRCENFMWITWAPFSISSWSKLCSADKVAEAVLMHRKKALGIQDESVATTAIDMNLVADTASRLWLIVLSRRQEEELIMTAEHLALVNHHETLAAG